MPKLTGKYQRLRNRLRELDIDQQYLAELLKRSTSYVSSCLQGKSDWQMQEVWAIVKICQIEPAEICKYFPPGGVSAVDEQPDPVHLFAMSLARMMQDYIINLNNANKSGGAA